MSGGRVLHIQELTSLRLLPLLRNHQAPPTVAIGTGHARWDRGMASGKLKMLFNLKGTIVCHSPLYGPTVSSLQMHLEHRRALAGCLAGCDPNCQVQSDLTVCSSRFDLALHQKIGQHALHDSFAESLGGAKGQQAEEELSLDSKLMHSCSWQDQRSVPIDFLQARIFLQIL